MIFAKWETIQNLLKEVPTRVEFIEMIESVGLCFDDFEALYGPEKIKDAVLYGKDLKDRYSVLWLYYMYGDWKKTESFIQFKK